MKYTTTAGAGVGIERFGVGANGQVIVDAHASGLTGASQAEVLKSALKNPDIQKYLEKQQITRVVYVPGKILNIISM